MGVTRKIVASPAMQLLILRAKAGIQRLPMLVGTAKAGIQLLLPVVIPAKVGYPVTLFWRSLEEKSFRCPAGSGQLFAKRQKVAKKRLFFLA
jgi:hypothetical protein